MRLSAESRDQEGVDNVCWQASRSHEWLRAVDGCSSLGKCHHGIGTGRSGVARQSAIEGIKDSRASEREFQRRVEHEWFAGYQCDGERTGVIGRTRDRYCLALLFLLRGDCRKAVITDILH